MKELIKIALRYLLKKPNYLKKSIWFVSILVAREIGAIGAKTDWLELSSEVKYGLEPSSWQYWTVRILEVIFIGGNWFVFGALVGLLLILCAVLVASKKNQPIVIGKHHYHSQLETIEGFIQAFRPISANDLAKQALKDIESSYLQEDEKNALTAKTYWLMGRCRTATGDEIASVYENHVKSYQLEPSNKTYRERACVSFYFLDRKDEALVLANEILSADNFSERASAVKLGIEPAFIMQLEKKSRVTEGQTFRRIYIQILMVGRKDEDAFRFMEKEFSAKPKPSTLDFSNIDYWESIGRYAFMKGFRSQPNPFVSVRPDYSKNELVNYGHALLDAIHARIKDTEAVETLGYQITLYYYFYCHYLLYGQADSVRSMRSLALKVSISKGLEFRLDVLFCFTQLGLYQETLNFADQLGELRHPFVPLMKFIAFKEQGKNDESEYEFIEYLQRLTVIGDLDVNNLLGFFDGLNKDKISDIFTKYVSEKTFEQELSRTIVFCYAHRYLPEFSGKIESNTELLLKSYESLSFELKQVVLITLQAIQKFKTVVDLIEQHHDWRTEEVPLKLYTASVLIIREDGPKILEVLKYRRTHLPEERLYLEELKIQSQVGNFTSILELVESGLKLFPENLNLRFYQIFSLYKKSSKEGLIQLLKDDLLNMSFPWKQKYVIAKICVENGKADLGFELFYRETLANYSSPAIKEHYFALVTMSGKNANWPPHIIPDTYALVEVNGKQNILEITPTTVEENVHAKSVLNLKVGDTVDVKLPLTGKTSVLKVLHIYDKYSGLVNKIRQELEDSDISGMNFKSVEIPGSKPEDFIKKLIEEFGEAGEERKNHHEESLTSYHTGKITFSELVAQSYNKVFDVYSLLTSSSSKGFRVVPLNDFKDFHLPAADDVVIDLTTLPILFEISEKFPELLNRKFIISQYAIDYIESELEESKFYPEERMTVVITTSGVQPHVQSSEITKQQIAKLERMLAWVEANCETRFSSDRLNMALKHPELIRENDFYYNCLIDTTFLSTGRLLVSDDTMHYKLPSGAQTISIEYFLSHFYKDRYKVDLLPILIRYHYIGIRVYSENLITEFKKPFYGGKSTFDYCLENLSHPVNHDERVIEECLDFVKFLYLESMPLQAKKDYSQKVFLHALKQFPNGQWLKRGFLDQLKSKFNLLPTFVTQVMDDATTALQILNRRV